MSRRLVLIFGVWLSAWAVVAKADAGGERLIPVFVTAKVEPAVVKRGEPIPLAITVANGLKGPVSYSSYSLKPNAWNGETVNLTLVDVYRDGKPGSVFLGRPKVGVPAKVAGMAAHTIKAGESLTVTTDARKWEVIGGWVPGKYKATARVENLSVEGGRCTLSVHSAPFEFEVR